MILLQIIHYKPRLLVLTYNVYAAFWAPNFKAKHLSGRLKAGKTRRTQLRARRAEPASSLQSRLYRRRLNYQDSICIPIIDVYTVYINRYIYMCIYIYIPTRCIASLSI